MSDTFAIVLPVFILVALGFGAARFGTLGARAGEGLTVYVFTFAVPALLIRTLAGAPLPDANPALYWLAYFAGVAVVWAAATAIGRRVFGLSGTLGAIAGFSTGQANTILMGIPLIIRTFGDAGSVPLSLLVAIHLPITMTAATLLVERTLGGTGGWRGIAVKLATHPILLGIAAGVVLRVWGVILPEPVTATLKLLGDSATPCALFAMGAALAQYGLGADIRFLAALSVLKLVIHPAIVFALAHAVFGLPPVWTGVAVLFAACPSGINAYLLAERYKVGVGLTSGAIAVTTALSPISTTFWVWLVTR